MPPFETLPKAQVTGDEAAPPEACAPMKIDPPTAADFERDPEIDYRYSTKTDDGIRHKRPIYTIAETWIRRFAASKKAHIEASLSGEYLDRIRMRLIELGAPKANSCPAMYFDDAIEKLVNEHRLRADANENLAESLMIDLEESEKFIALRTAALALADSLPPAYLNQNINWKILAVRKASELTPKPKADDEEPVTE